MLKLLQKINLLQIIPRCANYLDSIPGDIKPNYFMKELLIGLLAYCPADRSTAGKTLSHSIFKRPWEYEDLNIVARVIHHPYYYQK